MEDIKYSKENIKFALRVGAIIYDKNKEKVLSFRGNDMNFYMLPGGKIKEFETSEEAVIREVKEELGYTDIKFDYTGVSEDIVDKLKVHQVTINYKGIFEKEILDNEFTSIESDWIRFKWFNIDELDNIEIHPKNIVNMIKNETNHIIEKIDM